MSDFTLLEKEYEKSYLRYRETYFLYHIKQKDTKGFDLIFVGHLYTIRKRTFNWKKYEVSVSQEYLYLYLL